MGAERQRGVSTGTAGEDVGRGEKAEEPAGVGGGGRAARRQVCGALALWGRGDASGVRQPLYGSGFGLGPFLSVPLPRRPLVILAGRSRAPRPGKMPPNNTHSPRAGAALDLASGDDENRVRETRLPNRGRQEWASRSSRRATGALPVSPLLPFLGLV